MIKKKLIQNLLKNEKNMGKLTSITSVIIANILNYILNIGFGINIQESSGISLYLIGNILGYVLDLLFAKKKLYLIDKNGNPKLIDNFNDKIKFVLLSFVDKYFIKYVILCVIDAIIGLILLKYCIEILDENKILLNFKYRNLIVALLIPTVTYFLYVNNLRFDWAYEYNENFLLNVLMYVWLTIVLLFAVNINYNTQETKDKTQI
jgi:hypothetical protein|tara:strand:- start:1414 stop:2031 length:618 start_codon:yes stop_codon:yes gene_type:complete